MTVNNLTAGMAAIAADTIVVAVTWIRTARHIREALQLGIRVSVSATLLRDGELQRCVMLALPLTMGDDVGTVYFLYVLHRAASSS